MSLYTTHNDSALLSLMKEDDQGAFTTIYRRYWEGLYVTAAKALREEKEAEDVVQDVFLSLWKRRKEINIEGSLIAYLHTSVRYKAIHYIEKNITRRDYLALLTDVAVNILPADAEIKLQLKELQETIQNVVATMPPKMQEVYKLSRYEQLSHKQIAERLGISAETVKKHIQHAIQLIKVALGNSSLALPMLLYLFLV